MSDLIAHLLTHVNRRTNIERSESYNYAHAISIDTPAIADGRARHDGISAFNEPPPGTPDGRSSEDRRSISERAREGRLAAGLPHRDPRPRHQRRAPLRTRSGRPTNWISTAICEAVRLINDRGPVHQVDTFRQVFGPILALHILRERANPDSLLDAGAAAARQARLLVSADIAADCEAWVCAHLSILRGVEPYRLWRAAGSQSRRGGLKALGVFLGQHFGLTQAERQRLKVRMIRAVDVTPADQRETKREADRVRAEAKRRAAGVKPRVASEAIAAMMRETGLSRASCYRRLAAVKIAETGKNHDAEKTCDIQLTRPSYLCSSSRIQ